MAVLVLLLLALGNADYTLGRGFSKDSKRDTYKLLRQVVPVQDGAPVPELKPVGCYHDVSHDRALRNHYLTVKGGVPIKQMITECAKGAVAMGYVYFGIRSNECWGDVQGHLRYDRNGQAVGCVDGVGLHMSNFIYEITRVNGYCVVHFKLYPYDSPVNDKPCETCVCNRNGNVICTRIRCPSLPIHCEKILPPAAGQCCPVCDCVFEGRQHGEGSVWFKPIYGMGCVQCTCTNGQAVCIHPVCDCSSTYQTKLCCKAVCVTKPNKISFTIKPTESVALTLPRPPWLS